MGLLCAGSGVLACVLGAAASSSWADPAEQPVPLRSAPSPVLAPGPPCFLAPFCPRPLPGASRSSRFAGCLQMSLQKLSPSQEAERLRGHGCSGEELPG